MDATNLPVELPLGFSEVAFQLGHYIEIAAGVVYTRTGSQSALETLYSGWSGSAAQLAWYKTQKQIDLDTLFDEHFDLAKFIRDGTATNITATNVGTFLATITNNYRTKRAAIAAAANVAAVQAININTGWPSNP